MQTQSFVTELADWTAEVRDGDVRAAQKHLDHLYHLSASLVASKDFQKIAMQRWHHPVDQQVIEHIRLFLGLIQAATELENRNPQTGAVPFARAA